jgi:hypothetical protein
MTGFARNRRERKPDHVPDQQLTSPVGDVPVGDVSGLTSWQASRWAEVTGNSSHSVIGNGAARTNMVAGLRALADFLEANPAVPIPRYGHDFGISTSGSDEQKRSQVKFASLAIGEDFTDDTKNGQCWTQRRFGSVRYRIFAVSDAAVQRYQRAVKSQGDAEPGANRFLGSEDDR